MLQKFLAGAGDIDADKRIAKKIQPRLNLIFQGRDRRIVDLFLPVDIQGGTGDINRPGRFPVTFHMFGDKPGRQKGVIVNEDDDVARGF